MVALRREACPARIEAMMNRSLVQCPDSRSRLVRSRASSGPLDGTQYSPDISEACPCYLSRMIGLMKSARGAVERCCKIVALPLLTLFLSGCNVEQHCLNPGEGFTSAEKKVIINADPSKRWINAQVSVKSGHTLDLIVEGYINRCATTENAKLTDQTKQLTIHGSVCNDGSMPRYPQRPPYDVTGVDNNINICPGIGIRSGVMPKLDTGISVYNGDILKLQLEPYIVTITSCTALPPGVVMDSGHYDLDPEGRNKVSVVEACEKGGKFYINGSEVEFDAMLGKSWSLQVANIMSPEGNKYFHTWHDDPVSGQYWFAGSDLDLRIKDRQNNVDAFDCTKPLSDPVNRPFKDVSSEVLNKKCGRLCTQQQVNGTDWSTPCVCTYHMPVEQRQIDVGDGVSVPINEPKLDAEGMPIHYLQNLDMYVGGSTDGNSRTGDMQFTDVSLDRPLKVRVPDDKVLRKVFLHLYDPLNHNNFGGYRVKLTRSCPSNNGDRLYYYVGSEDPNVPHKAPGSPGTHLIGDLSAKDNVYTINKDGPAVEGRLYFAFDAGDEISSGQYTVILTEKISPAFVSKVVGWIMTPLTEIIRGSRDPVTGQYEGGVMRTMYNSTLGNGVRNIIYSAIVLYVAFSSLGYLTGLIAIGAKDLVVRLIKISVVSILLTDNSWQFFYDKLFVVFLDGIDYLIGVFSRRYHDDNVNVATDFAFLDATLGAILNQAFWERLFSLLFLGLPGLGLMIVMLYAVWHIVSATFFAVILYMVSMVSISFLISLSVVFISFSLFAYTKEFFNKWYRLLASIATQVVGVFALIALINELLQIYMQMAFNFGICTKCMLPLDLGPAGKPCLLQWFTPTGYQMELTFDERQDLEYSRDDAKGQHFMGLPMSLNVALMLYATAKALSVMTEVVYQLAHGIWYTMFTGVDEVAKDVSQGLKSLVGLDQESRDRRKRALTPPKSDGGGTQQTAARDKGANVNAARGSTRGGNADAVSGGRPARSAGGDSVSSSTRSSGVHGDALRSSAGGTARGAANDGDSLRGASASAALSQPPPSAPAGPPAVEDDGGERTFQMSFSQAAEPNRDVEGGQPRGMPDDSISSGSYKYLPEVDYDNPTDEERRLSIESGSYKYLPAVDYDEGPGDSSQSFANVAPTAGVDAGAPPAAGSERNASATDERGIPGAESGRGPGRRDDEEQ
jgi:type IV secretory pathway VirB6-like protein